MERSAIETKVIDLIKDMLGYEGEVGPRTQFIDDLGFDDLDVIDLTVEVETAFNIDIQDDEFDPFVNVCSTVADLVDVIAKKVA